MQLPSGAGVWPAFWLAGVNRISKIRTTDSAEIDILEAYGVDMTIAHHNIHVWAPTVHKYTVRELPPRRQE